APFNAAKRTTHRIRAGWRANWAPARGRGCSPQRAQEHRAGDGARVGVGLDERADHGAVDDRDEVAQLRLVAVVATAGEDLAEEGVELDAHRAHERGEVGPPPGADELLVAQEPGVEAAVAGLGA